MCGILFWTNIHHNIDQKLFYQCVKDIEHRGPDSANIFFSNGINLKYQNIKNFSKDDKKYDLAMGSTRFGTYDLKSSKCKMPMFSDDNRFIISYNGDIYNYLKLKSELIKKNITFKTNVDTEVLLKGFILEGKKFLEKINGDYSFVIFDIKTNSVSFSRDTFGQKPLFYFFDKNNLIICSEIAPIAKILKSQKITLNINNFFIENYFKTNEWAYDENSNLLAYDNVNSVLPGSINKIKLNKFEINQDLGLSLDNRLLVANTDACIEELEYNLLESIRLRIISDQKVGLFLSGGLDSSIITTLLKTKFPLELENINIYVTENLGNDGFYLKKLCKELNLNTHQLEIGYEDDVFDYIDDITKTTYLPTPVYGSGFGQFSMFKQVKKLNEGVILTGHGGDNIFCGYNYTLNAANDYFLKKDYKQAFYQTFLSNLFDQKLQNTMIKSLFQKSKISSFLPNEIKNKFNLSPRFANDNNLKSLFEMQIYDIKQGNLPTVLNLTDFVSMKNAIACRNPLIDINFLPLIKAPIENKFYNGFDRVLLRNILKKYENNIHKRKKKQGFRWSGSDMVTKHKERIYDTIIASDLYKKNSTIQYHIESNHKNNTFGEELMMYYSFSRYEEIIN